VYRARASPVRSHAMAPRLPWRKTRTEPVPQMTGVVFVHGIGTQPPRETFLDWATPIVRTLSELRRELDESASHAQPVGEDPVGRARIEGDRVWAEVEIPAGAGRPPGTWLVTESYWAGQIRAPGLKETLGYLQRRLRSIIRGITSGYGARESRRRSRLATFIADPAQRDSADDERLVPELRRALARRWAWIDWLDTVWQYAPVRWTLSIVAAATTMVALALFAPLRALPIKAVRERAELAALHTWLVDWFGDLPVLLDDRIQTAMVRAQLRETIRWLEERGCAEIVIVAHSGGAIVSFSTLLEMPDDGFRVTKLITHGQGLALGWRLLSANGPIARGNPLRGDLGAAHPRLRWVDFWASYDPAPAGPLAGVDGSPLIADPSPGPPAGSPIRVESRPVTNLMHMGLDHGGYWDNDEGFLVPLIRHIDDAAGDGSGSRFYRSPIARAARIERRRRRVGILLGWRWLAFAAGAVAIAGAALAPRGLSAVGNDVAWAWSLVPGNEWLSGPIDAVGGAVALVLTILGLGGLTDAIGDAGPTLLGAAIPTIGAFAIYARGVATWRAADEVERAKVRRERIDDDGEAWARSEACLLVGGLLALVTAAILPSVAPTPASAAVVTGILAAAAVGGLLLRRA
jgi:hypothetical protein